MRAPQLGETLRCASCGEDWKPIDQGWLKYFNAQNEVDRLDLYDEENDRFLGYDGCRDDENQDDYEGLDEDKRSYIRGSSYRPL